MKQNKQIPDSIKKAQETLENAAEALPGEMVEVDLDELDDISGAGNPFGNVPRVPTQPIDEDLRGNG